MEDADSLGIHATDMAKAKILDWETALQQRMTVWYESLALYVPGVELLQQEDAAKVKKDAIEPVGRWQLYLPSDIVNSMVCTDSLCNYKWQMREAAANDCLEGIRSNLRLYTYLESKQHQGVVGVAANTKSQTAFKKCMSHINGVTVRLTKQ